MRGLLSLLERERGQQDRGREQKDSPSSAYVLFLLWYVHIVTYIFKHTYLKTPQNFNMC
jgi:hypothetical protein